MWNKQIDKNEAQHVWRSAPGWIDDGNDCFWRMERDQSGAGGDVSDTVLLYLSYHLTFTPT
jgi:hypothetical protein